jgi:cytochrome b561
MSQPVSASIPMRDTPLLFGRVTRSLHWLMAALMLWQFLGMGLRLIFGRQPWLGYFVGSHQMIGNGAGLIGLAARLGHLALYVLMLVVTIVAILRAYGSTRAFAPFGFEIFPARSEEITWMTKLGGALHGELAWLLGALILGHVFMVGVHEAMWRDGTLARMLRYRRA